MSINFPGSADINTTPQGGGGGGTSNHNELNNLDYANSGHTGFMSASNHIEPSTTITVGSGKDYTTIQAAINSLNRKWCEGTVTIQIDSGVFNEQITLAGTNNMIKTLRVIGASDGSTEIHFEPANEWTYVFLIGNQPNLNLINLTISSLAQKNITGLQLVNSMVYLSNVNIKNIHYCGIASTFNSVAVNANAGITITNQGTTQGSKAISVDSSKFIFGGGAPTTINNFSEGISSSKGGVCSLNSNSMPTFTSVTTKYTPALNNMTTGTGWNVSGY